uniref:Uncharacterized protein n=1 Tax=Desulfacinum infernum TaxID=35837 RepID=A0A832A5X0_9BACT
MVELGPQGELYTDTWYRKLLEINPRRAWCKCEQNQWELFMTGLEDRAIEPFLKYLGLGFRRPTEKEWRSLFQDCQELKSVLSPRTDWPPSCAPPVSLWVKKGLFPLVEEGLLETLSGTKGCIGKPFQELLPNTWNPQDVREVNWDVARKFIGFRVVREMRHEANNR